MNYLKELIISTRISSNYECDEETINQVQLDIHDDGFREKSYSTSNLSSVLIEENCRLNWNPDSSQEFLSEMELRILPKETVSIDGDYTVFGFDKKQTSKLLNILSSSAPIKGNSTSHIDENSRRQAVPMIDRFDFKLKHGSFVLTSKPGTTTTKPPLNFVQAERLLTRIGYNYPGEVILDSIIEVEIGLRNMNLNEKNILLLAHQLENSCEFPRALELYSKSGLHSQVPYVAKLCIGVVYMKQMKYLLAQKSFSSAIKLIDADNTSNKKQDDLFCAYFNRSICCFKIGDDESGLSHITSAIELKPNHILSLEIQSLALQRLGKYMEAVRPITKLQQIRPKTAPASFIGQGKNSIPNIISLKDDSKRLNRRKGVLFTPATSVTRDENVPIEEVIVISDPINPNLSNLAEKEILDRTEQKKLELIHSAEAEYHKTSLETFKIQNGFRSFLPHHIFDKPTVLQTALIVPPNFRQRRHLEDISIYLRLIRELENCSSHDILSLCQAAEYRVVPSGSIIYKQHLSSDCITLLMSGSVQQILEGKKITDIDANIGTVSPTSFICAFDILFAVNKSEFHRKIKDLVVSKRPNEKIAINEADDTSSDNRKIFLNSQHSSPSSSYCSNELDETNESISDELSGSNDVKNHFRPTSSSTYKSVMPCELMIFSKTSFSKVLRLLFESKYLDVLNTLFATHIFDDWKYEDIVMLARMGNIKHYKIEDFVTKQGGKADYFYIILRGTCGVYRHQNESGLLRKRLQELQKQADFHDQLYVYHHISSTRLRSHSNQLELSNKEFSKILDDYHGHGNHIHREINNTNTLESTKCRPHTAGELVTKPLAEIKRAEIQKEIESIEEKLSKLNIREGEETTVETIENFEIARLKWPMMFGEESILNPDIGEHPTTIKCLTGCEIFQIHSSQMKSFPNSEHFKEKIQLVAIKPPDDNLVHERISSSKKWEVFKSEYIVSLQTNKIKKSPQKISKFCF